MIEAFLIRIVMAVVALVVLGLAVFLLSRMFDALLDVEFKKAFDQIEQDPRAMADYYGKRWLGLSLASGLVVCAAMLL